MTEKEALDLITRELGATRIVDEVYKVELSYVCQNCGEPVESDDRDIVRHVRPNPLCASPVLHTIERVPR